MRLQKIRRVALAVLTGAMLWGLGSCDVTFDGVSFPGDGVGSCCHNDFFDGGFGFSNEVFSQEDFFVQQQDTFFNDGFFFP